MKVLLINGSPHATGSTYTALHEMEKVFVQEGIETELVQVGNKDVRGCIACGTCGTKGKCVFDDIVNEIAEASNYQATAIMQIDQAIDQVSQVVQTNSATSEECAAAAEELTGQANGLRRMVSQYKLDDSIAKMGYSANDKKDSFFDEEDPESIIALDGGFGKY